jgi:lysophospholipase L1-like esterase
MGHHVTSAVLAPVLVLQGRRLRRATAPLPEPPGPRAGTRGDGPPLRLLILGDSAAAGVGAASQEEALSGRLVAELAPTFRVTWALVARAGATTAGTLRHLVRHPLEPDRVFDVAVLSLGGNDVTAGRGPERWLADLDALAELLRTRHGVRQLLCSGLPPMHAFPAFPQPLRWHLGRSARRFDAALARWVAGRPDCEHVPLALPPDDGLFAPDGLHPGPPAYQLWGAELARRVRARWAPASGPGPRSGTG